jgi:hypothetical protein
MFILSPFAKGHGERGYTNLVRYDHSSTLKTIEEIFGLERLQTKRPRTFATYSKAAAETITEMTRLLPNRVALVGRQRQEVRLINGQAWRCHRLRNAIESHKVANPERARPSPHS